MSQKKTGEILLESKLINEQQLHEALEMQRILPGKTIGQMLCKLGHIKEDDLSYILEQSGNRQRLGDILLKEKLIDSEKLYKALLLGNKGIPLHKALLKLHYISEEQLAKILSRQYDLPFTRINQATLETDAAKVISASFSQKHEIVPVSIIGKSLTLAMRYPLKFSELKDLERSINLKIIPVIATGSDIVMAQQRLYKKLSAGKRQDNESFEIDLSLDSLGEILSSTGGFEQPEVEDEARRVSEKDSIIVKLVNKIIYDANQLKASDIHIEPYPGKQDVIVRMRVDGECRIYEKIPYRYKYAIPSRIKIMADLDIAERRRPQDGRINLKDFGSSNIELRVATMPTSAQLEDIVLRVLDTGKPPTLEQLGLSDRNLGILKNALTKPHGLILAVGPTGSGKTTTLHSAIASLNRPQKKIWTVEDPVEITQHGLRQVQVNYKLGLTFAKALRSFLRLDPDIIMVGEMRDQETALISVEASLTGHLVLSTLHTNSAVETIARLLEMGIDPYGFADSLLCILGQRLARTLCPDCKEPYIPSSKEMEELVLEFGKEAFSRLGIVKSSISMFRGCGCDKCAETGYRGRIGIQEILESSDAVKQLIKERADSSAIRKQAVLDGMLTLKQNGITRVLEGKTDIYEIRRVCAN